MISGQWICYIDIACDNILANIRDLLFLEHRTKNKLYIFYL